jgi:hypothetical protein
MGIQLDNSDKLDSVIVGTQIDYSLYIVCGNIGCV